MSVEKVKCEECGALIPVWDALEAAPSGSEGRTPTVTLCSSCFLDWTHFMKKSMEDPDTTA